MKTAEEILNEVLVDVEDRPTFFREQDVADLIGQAQKEAYTAGYNEAMRWRNPKKESPPVGAYVQLKTFDTFHNRQMYTHDEYLGNNKWRFCEYKYLDITGWRPINN